MNPWKSLLLLVLGVVIGVAGCGGGEKKITGPEGQGVFVWEAKWANGKTKFTYQYYIAETQDTLEQDYIVRVEKNHVLAGYYKAYYEDGKPYVDANYKYGVPDGKWVVYYGNGHVREEANYIAGEVDGRFVRYYVSGQEMFEYNYKDGKPDGKWAYYDENGNVTSETTYANGTCVSGC